MELKLKYIGCDVLRTQGSPVTEFGAELERHLPRMLEIMREEGGIGLAAPQVGISKHFFIVVANVDDEEREEDEILLMANVKILEAGKKELAIEEGCLSIPGLRAEVMRAERIRVGFEDSQGRHAELETDGLLARVIQHELDHCEGVLFVDRLSPAQGAVLKKQIVEIQAEYASRN